MSEIKEEQILYEKNVKILPIISEKSRNLINSQNTYVFKILPPNLNKQEIKYFIEKRFNVKVEEIRVVNYPKRIRGRTRILNVRPKFKKAYVKLSKGYSLSIFE